MTAHSTPRSSHTAPTAPGPLVLGLIGLAALGVWLAPGLQAAAANVVKATGQEPALTAA